MPSGAFLRSLIDALSAMTLLFGETSLLVPLGEPTKGDMVPGDGIPLLCGAGVSHSPVAWKLLGESSLKEGVM